MRTFVDTSAIYAAFDNKESQSARVADLLRAADVPGTTDHVLVETWLLARSRWGPDTAEMLLARCFDALEIEIVSAADVDRSRQISDAYTDQRFSFVDRTSFSVMERLGVHRVVSLDDDFLVYRFGPGRRRAFEVLR